MSSFDFWQRLSASLPVDNQSSPLLTLLGSEIIKSRALSVALMAITIMESPLLKAEYSKFASFPSSVRPAVSSSEVCRRVEPVTFFEKWDMTKARGSNSSLTLSGPYSSSPVPQNAQWARMYQ